MTKSRGLYARRRTWSAADRARVRRLYPDTRTEDIARQFGVAKHCIYRLAQQLGLKKSAAFHASPASGRLRPGSTVGLSGRFRPGQVSWNKGRKGWCAGGRSALTRFKPGNVSARWDQEAYGVGALRINTDGGLDIKVAPGARNWVALARYVWQSERGPIPRGHVVRVLGPDPYDCADVRNLVLLSRQQLMRENTLHRYPPAITELVHLRAALTRQINRRTPKTQPTHA